MSFSKIDVRADKEITFVSISDSDLVSLCFVIDHEQNIIFGIKIRNTFYFQSCFNATHLNVC